MLKGTMIYLETKDMYYTMQRLGHKNIKNTLLYVQLEEALFQGETIIFKKVAKIEKEICSLVEAGFEYARVSRHTKILENASFRRQNLTVSPRRTPVLYNWCRGWDSNPS